VYLPRHASSTAPPFRGALSTADSPPRSQGAPAGQLGLFGIRKSAFLVNVEDPAC
jgi:hypothetical protein